MENQRRLSYIIVTYYSEIHFPGVIENIRANTPYQHEIIVIDNGCREPGRISGDKVIFNESNLYYTKGVNQGLEIADGRSDYIVLMNPDVRLTNSTIPTMIDEMAAAGAGISGAILVYHDYVVQHGGGKPYDDLDDQAMLAMDGHEHRYSGKAFAEVRDKFPDRVRWVTGALMALSRGTVKEIGVLNDRYAHHRSDSEYCLRANRRGIPVICSSGVALHLSHKSGKRRNRIHEEYTRIKYRYYEWRFQSNSRKHLSPPVDEPRESRR
jgi:GT2 family glycosyltransferase